MEETTNGVRVYAGNSKYWQCIKCYNLFAYKKLAEKCYAKHDTP